MAHRILIYTHPELGERRFELEAGRSYRIGSKPDCDIVIAQKDVSRRHAILESFEGRFQITDLHSKNGTFVNGQRVASAEFSCGDTLSISSARLDVVEVSSDSFHRLPEMRPTPPPEARAEDSSDTVQFRSDSSVEDLVELLETAAGAARTGSVGETLCWGVTTLGLEAAVILYRDDRGGVAMLGSAGDLEPLVADERRLGALVSAGERVGSEEPGSRRVEEVAEGMLVAPLCGGHILVLRYSGPLPAVADIRALMAAVDVVLLGGRVRRAVGDTAAAIDQHRGPEGGGPGDVAPRRLDERSLVGKSLDAARDEFERWMVSRVLAECSGNQSRAARRLGMSRAGLFKKLKKLDLR